MKKTLFALLLSILLISQFALASVYAQDLSIDSQIFIEHEKY